MATKIYLKGVRAYGFVGLLPEENVLGQWFEVNVTLWVDFTAATVSDNIADSYDYRIAINAIESLIQTSKFALIERLAGAIADRLLEDQQIQKLELMVIKQPPIPNFLGSVAIEITRERPIAIPTAPMTAVISETIEPVVIPQVNSATPPIIKSIYTDGACSGNPGKGGWGMRANFSNGSVHEMGGGNANTTNNQMELQGAIAALEYFSQHPQSEPIQLFTDSKYVIDGITKWIKGWKKNGWQTSTKQPVKNKELWQLLDQLNSAQVSWHWVEGHAGDPNNERCDAIARSYTTGKTVKLITR